MTTIDDANTWRLTLEAWWQADGHLTPQRTMYPNGQWGFTQNRLRKAWGVLHRAAESGHVFTNLHYHSPSTASPLEGLNGQIRHLLRDHRGMQIEHHRRAVEWFLLLHEIPIDHAHRHAAKPTPAPEFNEPDELIGAARYDPGLDANEGLWHRTGWLRSRRHPEPSRRFGL